MKRRNLTPRRLKKLKSRIRPKLDALQGLTNGQREDLVKKAEEELEANIKKRG